MVEKKISLHPYSKTQEIDFRYPKKYRPLSKKGKDNATWKYCNKGSNKNKNKTKSHNCFFANQRQTQDPKKDKRG